MSYRGVSYTWNWAPPGTPEPVPAPGVVDEEQAAPVVVPDPKADDDVAKA